MVKSSTFNRHEVENFLINTGNTFAARCWYVDKVHGATESRICHTEVAKWFRGYFPSNMNQYLFRLLECEVTQYFENDTITQ